MAASSTPEFVRAASTGTPAATSSGTASAQPACCRALRRLPARFVAALYGFWSLAAPLDLDFLDFLPILRTWAVPWRSPRPCRPQPPPRLADSLNAPAVCLVFV